MTMSEVTSSIELGTAVSGVPEAAPRAPKGPRPTVGWMRENLFSSWLSTAVTLILALLVAKAAWAFVQWGVINAVWWVPDSQSQACRALRGTGACWAVVTEKHRFILFGTYPYDQQWRPLLAIILFVGLYVISGIRRFWRKELFLIWIVALVAIGVLMWAA